MRRGYRSILPSLVGKVNLEVRLAATEISKLKRREMSAVNLNRTCEHIMDYIMVRVPSHSGRSRPRFSLYLSSQLMFGVVRVFSNQNQYLLALAWTAACTTYKLKGINMCMVQWHRDELNNFFVKVHRAIATEAGDIDLKDICRSATVTSLDPAEMASLNQIGYNPFFGRLKELDELSDTSHQDLFPWYGDQPSGPSDSLSSPEIKKSESSKSSRGGSVADQPIQLKSVLGSPHTVTSIDEITLREPTSFTIPQPEIQDDLLMFEGAKLDVLPEEPLDLSKYFTTIPVPSEDDKTTTEQREVLSPKEKTPAPAPPAELPRVLRERHQPLSPGVTPAPETSKTQVNRRVGLMLNLGEVTPSPSKKRKRRHLAVDQDIKLSKNHLKDNLSNTHDILRDFANEIPDIRMRTADDLLKHPSRRIMQRCFSDLWDQRLQYGLRTTDSETELPCWTVPDLTENGSPPKRQHMDIAEAEPGYREDPSLLVPDTEMQRQDDASLVELPIEDLSVEMARDASLLSKSKQLDSSRTQNITPVSIHHSLLSDHDKSDDSSILKDSTKKRSSRRSTRSRGHSMEEEIGLLPEESLTEMSSISKDFSRAELSTVAEEQESQIHAAPMHLPREEINANAHRFIRQIDSYTSTKRYTTFTEICPPDQYSKKRAVEMFTVLLELCGNSTVQAKQNHSFGSIHIKRGINW